MKNSSKSYTASVLFWLGLVCLASSISFGQHPIAVPFESAGNLIIIPVSIGSSRPLSFLLDTGASGTVVSAKQAVALGLKFDGQGNASTQGGQIEAAEVKNVSLRIGRNARLHNLTAAAISLSGLEAGLGRRVDGILGYEAFDRYVVEIDYAARLVKFYDPKNFHYSGRGTTVQITLDDNTPFAKSSIVTAGGFSADGKFLINTGSTGAVLFNGPYTDKNKLLDHVRDTRAVTFGALIAGGSSGRIGRIKHLRFANFDIVDAFANFSLDTKGDDADENAAGMIGSEILRRFRLIVNYSRNQIIFEPTALLSEPYEFDMSGMSIAAGGEDLRTFKVRSLIEGSPAEAAGLRAGDLIVSINGRATATISLQALRQMFRRPNKNYTLQIKRDNKFLNISIRTRRII